MPTNTKPSPYSRGFTLIELSIVLIIIGLIIGGVLTGQSLVQQATLRAVIEEIKGFEVSINTFKLKYDTLPGDMPNADSFWSGCGSGTTTAQCNGDGDGLIENSANSIDNETFRAWQHLTLAGLVSGTYDGVGEAGVDQASQTGSNSPLSAYSSGIFSLRSDTGLTTHLGSFTIPTASYIWLGGFFAGNIAYGELIKPLELQSIDTKIDDGIPNLGRFLGTNISSVIAADACIDGILALQTYRTDHDAAACVMEYRFTQ